MVYGLNIFLHFYLFMQLSTNKQLSTLICATCIQNLRDANKFRLMVVNAEQQLLSNVLDKETVFINSKYSNFITLPKFYYLFNFVRFC